MMGERWSDEVVGGVAEALTRMVDAETARPAPQEPRVLPLDVSAHWDEVVGVWYYRDQDGNPYPGPAGGGYPTEAEALAAGNEWLRASLRLTLEAQGAGDDEG